MKNNFETFDITAPDTKHLKARKYNAENSKGAVIIVHGMQEHQKRYADFAEFLAKNNYNTYTYDQRGHGETAGSVEDLGFFTPKNGWQTVVNDLHLLVQTVKEENPEHPVYILGHSMGSFVTRTYILDKSKFIDGVILSGTAPSAGLLGQLGIFLSYLTTIFRGKKHPAKLLDNIAFGDFNKKIKPKRTKQDWLSRDEKVVDDYINDPYCGTLFSAQFFNDMLGGIETANHKNLVKSISKKLSIHLLSGEKDPVGEYGEGVKKVKLLYENAGIENLSMKLYPEGRHEMLNELNKNEVYSDILNWLNAHSV
ncbi:MAG: alpha/beta hydrolase [Bacteroidota bacterium]|nr:alpha/beta hydrolase [Bacteroidota bacterium]